MLLLSLCLCSSSSSCLLFFTSASSSSSLSPSFLPPLPSSVCSQMMSHSNYPSPLLGLEKVSASHFPTRPPPAPIPPLLAPSAPPSGSLPTRVGAGATPPRTPSPQAQVHAMPPSAPSVKPVDNFLSRYITHLKGDAHRPGHEDRDSGCTGGFSSDCPASCPGLPDQVGSTAAGRPPSCRQSHARRARGWSCAP